MYRGRATTGLVLWITVSSRADLAMKPCRFDASIPGFIVGRLLVGSFGVSTLQTESPPKIGFGTVQCYVIRDN